VIGQCISASSDTPNVSTRGPLQAPELGLLEAEMSRVFGLGYSWPDTYAQCVFQTLLYNIELRQQYDKQQCRHLLEDTDDTDGEEDPILFVPEPDEDSLTQGQTEHQQTADSPYDDEEQQNWLQLQNVLNNFQLDNNPGLSEYIIIPEDEDEEIYPADDLPDDDQMIFVPLDEENPDLSEDFPPNLLPRNTDMYNFQPEDFSPYQQPIFIDLPDIPRLPDSDINHPLEKREADSGFEYILPEPDTEDLLMASLEPEDYSVVYDNDDEDDEIYPEISNYDFEYEDPADQDDDILYYNPDIEPITVQSVFNRRERLDVKKPGPFYSNSPNNFYLDKLLPDESDSDEEVDEDAGQTEYEYPTASAQENRQKKGMREPLLSYTEPEVENQGYLYININNRFRSLSQANQLLQFVADHLELPKQVFSESRAETSRIVLKVNSNPKQLNATTMAKILDADASLKEHAKEELGIDISSFDAEEKVTVVSVHSGNSRLFLLLFLLTAGIAALLLAAAILLFLRRRSQRKTKQLPEEKKSREGGTCERVQATGERLVQIQPG